MNNKYERIKKLIDENSDIINFAPFGKGISEEWIKKADEKLGFDLPGSYKWWCKNYSGGQIGADEIYSIYEDYLEDCNNFSGGDIGYMYYINQESGAHTKDQLVICDENDGETYYFKLSEKSPEGEYPVYCYHSGEKFADDFLDFLEKFISLHKA